MREGSNRFKSSVQNILSEVRNRTELLDKRAKEQFNEVQMELERLTSEKLTMVPSLD